MIYEIKNLTIINLTEICISANNDTQFFCFNNNIKNTKDQKTLLKHFFFSKFLENYSKKTKPNILLYFNEIENFNFNQIIKFIKNKLKFPMIITNLPINNFLLLLENDSPEYDEAINNNFNLIDSFGKFKKYIKTSGLLDLNKKYSNISEQLSLLINKF